MGVVIAKQCAVGAVAGVAVGAAVVAPLDGGRTVTVDVLAVLLTDCIVVCRRSTHCRRESDIGAAAYMSGAVGTEPGSCGGS